MRPVDVLFETVEIQKIVILTSFYSFLLYCLLQMCIFTDVDTYFI